MRVYSLFSRWARNSFLFVATLLTGPVLAADLPDGFYIDHGFTYFQVDTVTEPIDGKMTDMGWELIPHIRIFGDAPDRSSIKVVLRDGRKVIAERRTVTKVYKSGDPNLGLVVSSTSAGSIDPHFLVEGGIQGKLPVATGTGEFEVDVSYIDGDSEKEYEAHTYTINVGAVENLDSAAGELLVRPPDYFVSRHQEVLSTVLTPWGYYRRGGGGPTYRLLWNASPAEQSMRPENEYLRCTVDGEAIKLGNPAHPQVDQLQNLRPIRI